MTENIWFGLGFFILACSHPQIAGYCKQKLRKQIYMISSAVCVAAWAIHRRQDLELFAYCEPKNNQGQQATRTGQHNILPNLHPQPQILTGCKNPSVNAISYKFSFIFFRKELGIYAAIYAAAAVIMHICLVFAHIPLWKEKSYSRIGKSVSAPTLVISI